MADTISFTSKVRENHPNPSKFYNHFLYKSVIASIFLLVLPLFPSQPPEFINQTLHTRSWEFLQLIFVGIAVSYGLFSKRNDETEKEHSSKFDDAHSYVSRLLQVSSVFDDETESPFGNYENKVQTWNSQYHRGEPMVMIAPESSVLEKQRSNSPQIGQKPLLLPVRSLKSRVSGSDVTESTNEPFSRSSSNLGSNRFSRNLSNSRLGEFRGGTPLELEGNVEENIVLRSPIPWRSRSGRMEMKEDVESPPPYSLPLPMEEPELNKLESHSFSSQSFRSSRNNSSSSSPKNLSPSPSTSLEFQAKNVEDLLRRKSFHKSSPPPPPPPPPPFPRKSPLTKSNSSATKEETFPQRELKRSIKSVPQESSGNDRRDLQNRANSGAGAAAGAEWWARTSGDGPIRRQSARTVSPIEPIQGPPKSRDFSEDFVKEKRAKEFEEDKMVRENASFVSKQSFSKFPTEEKKESIEQVLMETDEDAETDDDGDDESEEISRNDQEVAHNSASDGGPDVDKKADEFIAKFREQIRLQRIASIRRSTTGQLPRNSVGQ